MAAHFSCIIMIVFLAFVWLLMVPLEDREGSIWMPPPPYIHYSSSSNTYIICIYWCMDNVVWLVKRYKERKNWDHICIKEAMVETFHPWLNNLTNHAYKECVCGFFPH